jgi:hypothetical protein
MSTGCGPSSVVAPTGSAVPFADRYGYAILPPLDGLSVALTDSRAAFVHPVAARAASNLPPLALSILTPWTSSGPIADTKLILVYSSSSIAGEIQTEMVSSGSWIVTEGRPAGQDAAAVQAAAQRIGRMDLTASVAVASSPGTLVYQDPIDEAGSRPFELYWSDRRRDMSIQAVASPDAIGNLARAFYC